MELSETVVTSFTTLVTAVILFYFGSRTWENVKTIEANAKTDSNQQKDQ
jgi:preprotein translocase subunit SecF